MLIEKFVQLGRGEIKKGLRKNIKPYLSMNFRIPINYNMKFETVFRKMPHPFYLHR
jgi:hypothetical protein